jgi:hypothetical protein
MIFAPLFIVQTASLAKAASANKQYQKKNTEGTAKVQNQASEPKRQGRKSTVLKSPSKNDELRDKPPSTVILRQVTRRKSAIQAANRIPAVLQTEESSPDTLQEPIPVPLKRNSTQTKVSIWLKESETGAIPTQDPPVVSTTPVTQSTLIAISQSNLFEKTPTITQIPSESKISERIIKDPYEFIPSQPDSIKKQPRGGVKLVSKPAKPVTQKKVQTIGNKKNEDINEKSFYDKRPMLLFQSQSEQYIAEQEEKRLKELEKPIYLTTEAATTKQKGLKGKALPVRQYQAKKVQRPTEDTSEECISELIEHPRKKSRGSRGQPILQSPQDKHEKMQKKLEDAEKHCLVIEKTKIKSNEIQKNKFFTHNEPIRSKRRSLSIAIESPPVSVVPDKITEYLEKINAAKKIKTAPSPGFSRIKKMKSDFKSPVRNSIVPLDVSTSSLKDTSATLAHQIDLLAIDQDIVNISSPTRTRKKESRQVSFNSSLGAPDFDKNILLHKAVEQMEFEIQNNIITESDLDTTNDTQYSTTLIENSVPPDTNTSTFKHVSKPKIVESTQDEENSDVLQEVSKKITQDTQHSTTLIENSVPFDANVSIFKCISNAQPIESTQDSSLKETQTIQTKDQCIPLQELSNKIDIACQRDTQMSQTTVNLLEKIHDLPKRKTFSLEADTGDIMIDIPTRESTQQQLLSLTSPSQSTETLDEKSAKSGNNLFFL